MTMRLPSGENRGCRYVPIGRPRAHLVPVPIEEQQPRHGETFGLPVDEHILGDVESAVAAADDI